MWLKSWEQVAKNIAPFFSIHFDSKKTQLLDFCTIWFGKKTWYPTTYTPNSSKVLEDWESSRYALTRDLQAFSLGSANGPKIKFLLTRFSWFLLQIHQFTKNMQYFFPSARGNSSVWSSQGAAQSSKQLCPFVFPCRSPSGRAAFWLLAWLKTVFPLGRQWHKVR